MARTLAPGVSSLRHGLTAALDAFTAALDSDRVLTSDADLSEFRDPYEPQSWEMFVPSAVVMPITVEEVQAIVRIANEHAIPLWTHGQGRNFAYGAPRRA